MIDKCTGFPVPLTVEMIKLAFAHSKELHVKEMDDIDKYNRLGITELLEFVARLGVLIFKERP